MKTLEEILKQPGLQVYQTGPDGGSGTLAQLNTSGKRNKRCVVVWSNGGGWDHVSISFADRCPTWEEMCVVKKIFFNPEETAIEYHRRRANTSTPSPTACTCGVRSRRRYRHHR